MANVIEILMIGRDLATGAITKVQASVSGLNTTLLPFGGVAGVAAVGIGAIGAAAAGAVLAVRGLAEEATHLSAFAQQSGVSVQAIQEIATSYERAGLTAGDAGLLLRYLNRAIQEQDPLLAHLNVTSHDTYEAYHQLADAVHASADPVKLAASFHARLGQALTISIPVMRQGSIALREIEKESRLAGAELGTDMVASLKGVDAQFFALDERLKAFRTSLLTDLVGPVSTGLSVLQGLAFEFDAVGYAMLRVRMIAAARFGNSKDVADLANQIDLLKQRYDALRLIGPPASLAGGGTNPPPVVPGTGMTIAQMKEAVEWITKLERVGGRDLNPLGFRANPKLKPDSMVDVPATVIDSKTKALQGFKDMLVSIMDAGNVMADGLAVAFNSLQFGFLGMFQSIGVGGDAFFKSVVQGAKGMVREIEAELSRLAAAKIFQLLLSFAGVPSIGITPMTDFGGGGVPVSGLTGGGGANLSRAGGGGGNTFNITTLAPSSVLAEILDPTGSFRRANLRVAELGAL